MRSLLSFAAIFLSIGLVQLGTGSLGPLDALAGAAHGFSTREIGLLGSAHFVGFLIGCWFTPRLMGHVGHGRAFAAVTALGVIGALLHPVVIGPYAWALFRIGGGVAVAGAFTVAESWLQAKLDNSDRGRVLGVYRTVDMAGQVLAQGVVAILDPTSYIAFNIVAMFACLSLVPLTVSRQVAPAVPSAPRLRLVKTFLLSPLGAAGALVVGLTSSSFRMVGPIYGAESGLSSSGIALFLGLGLAGAAFAQVPVGRLADKYDRRWVLVGLSIAALIVCSAATLGVAGVHPTAIYLVAFVFGASAFPLFSISTAHANDHAPPDFVVELSAALMFLFGAGAIVSPYLSANLVERYGPNALFTYIGVAHVALIVFSLFRMTRRETPEKRSGYRYMPRTSITLARLMKQRPELNADEAPKPEDPPIPDDAQTEASHKDRPVSP